MVSLRLGDNFYVTEDGILYAKGINIKGNIEADTGTIANFIIGSPNNT